MTLMLIQEMDKTERPREKMLARGAEALSDGELLAILLRTGRRGESALDLARRLLSLAGGRLGGLYECSPGYLQSLEGVGTARAAALLAAFEIGRRFMQEAAVSQAPITSAHQVNSLMHPRLKGLGHEECWEILLDRKNVVIDVIKVTTGSLRSTVIDSPAMIRNAIERSAASIIVVHNHPGTDPEPSRADISQTKILRDACSACGLRLLDHVIISDNHFYSLNEEKLF